MVFVLRRNWRIKRIVTILAAGIAVATLLLMLIARRDVQKPKGLMSPEREDINYLHDLDINWETALERPADLYEDPNQVLLDMRNKSRLHKTVFERLHLSPLVKHRQNSPEYRKARWFLDALEDTLYPLNRTKYPNGVKQMYDGYRGRGIVMTSGSKHFKYDLLLCTKHGVERRLRKRHITGIHTTPFKSSGI